MLLECPGSASCLILSCRYAGIECTHTKREVLRNRLFAVLLTRLSFNYHLLETDGDTAELFEVQYKGEKIVLPDEFVNALMKSGHTIEISPATTLTTFGVGASVKEDDGTWTNVPITFFFRTGFETPEGRPVYFSAAHGGMDLDINGPLVGEGNRCNIQFYAAIEGLCGWHSNHNFDVPWYEKTRIAKVYNKEQTLEAVRLIGLLATVVNTIATEVRVWLLWTSFTVCTGTHDPKPSETSPNGRLWRHGCL